MTSKWTNRLKSVLAKTENSEVCLDSSLTITDKSPNKRLLSVIVSDEFRDSLKNNAFETEISKSQKNEKCLNQELTKADKTRNAPTLTAEINRLIAEGVKFEVSADSFEAFGLSNTERFKFDNQRKEILCTLQQSLLQKYLSPSDLQMFVDEAKERAAILSDGKTIEPPFEVLNEIVRDWFADMLEEGFEKG